MNALNLRVGRLEEKFDGFDAPLRVLEVGLATANARLNGLGGRLDDLGKRMDDLGRRMDDVTRRFDSAVSLAMGRVPTWWQMPVALAGTMTFVVGLHGAARGFGLVL